VLFVVENAQETETAERNGEGGRQRKLQWTQGNRYAKRGIVTLTKRGEHPCSRQRDAKAKKNESGLAGNKMDALGLSTAQILGGT